MTNIDSQKLGREQQMCETVGGTESEQLRGYFVSNETLLGKKDHRQESKFHQCPKQHVCNYGAISECGETSGTKPKSILDVSDLWLLRSCCLKTAMILS